MASLRLFAVIPSAAGARNLFQQRKGSLASLGRQQKEGGVLILAAILHEPLTKGVRNVG
jgi:hypothetical protein